MELTDTIAAISTPLGNGGVGVIRISGSDVFKILNKIFVSVNGKKISEILNRVMILGKFYSHSNQVLDEGLLCIFEAPNSFTGENVAEIYCHGGLVLCKQILKSCIANGARQAEAGEFTKRAFLNRKIDLTKAEAISDLIHAKTESEITMAANHLTGNIDLKVSELQAKLLDIVSQVLADIDFPDHLIDEISLEKEVSEVLVEVIELLSTCETGKLIKNGLNVSLIGIPNVGKSSLFNLLVQENRAIVTDIPGTTRDVIKEQINIQGRLVNLYDTAGIRNLDESENKSDEIEKIGIEKSRETIKIADLILLVLDSSCEMHESEIELLKELLNSDKKVIIINNKIDLNHSKTASNISVLKKVIESSKKSPEIIDASVINKTGFEIIIKNITNLFEEFSVDSSRTIISNSRHEDILLRSKILLQEILNTLENKMPIDVILPDLETCLKTLGEFSGNEIGDRIVENIFSKFCVGK